MPGRPVTRSRCGSVLGRLATGQQLGAFVVLLPAALVIAPQPAWSAPALLACTAFAYILYFRLIETAGPIFANTVTLLVPVFGILWGSIFLGESVSWALLLGLALVMSSVLATSPATGRRARLAPNKPHALGELGEPLQAGV